MTNTTIQISRTAIAREILAASTRLSTEPVVTLDLTTGAINSQSANSPIADDELVIDNVLGWAEAYDLGDETEATPALLAAIAEQIDNVLLIDAFEREERYCDDARELPDWELVN